MTKAEDSPVTRETNAKEKGRPLIVTVKGGGLEYRIKGRREVVYLDHEVALAAARKVAFREAGGQLPGRMKSRTFKRHSDEDLARDIYDPRIGDQGDQV